VISLFNRRSHRNVKSMTCFFKILLLLVLAFSSGANGQGQRSALPDSLQAYVDTVLSIVQKKSLYINQVDWHGISDSAKAIVANARNIEELMPAVSYIFTAIGDFHGGLNYRERWYGMEKKSVSVRDELREGFKTGARVRTKILESEYGYVFVPPVWALTEKETSIFAQQLQDSVCNARNSNVRGWIVDLRLNLGGNMFAMIGGLGNIIGDGVLGTFIDRNGQEVKWSLHKGDVYEGEEKWTRIERRCPDQSSLKVVILISQLTCSSGEALAISFKGRSHVKFFGEQTSGYVTANDVIFIDKNSMFLIAEAYMADRNHTIYKDFVLPDTVISKGDNFNDLEKDLAVQAALKWLRSP